MKSKEPKQPKEKKRETKPRKSNEKNKLAPAQAAAAPELAPEVPVAAVNLSSNGAADHSAASVSAVEPTQEMIRMRAYELYMERGYQDGHQEDDWLIAERELKLRSRTV